MAEMHVLVVDNSPVIRRILVHVLEGEWAVSSMWPKMGWWPWTHCQTATGCHLHRSDQAPKIDGEKLSHIIRTTPELRDIFLVVLSGVALEDNDATLRIGADVCIAKGTATAMKMNIKMALERYRNNQRGASRSIEGLRGSIPVR